MAIRVSWSFYTCHWWFVCINLSNLYTGLGICSSVFQAICSFFVSERAICLWKKVNPSRCSFVMSNLSESLMVALLSWATWANCECFKQIAHFCEWFAQGRSLKWGILSERAKSKWAKERIHNPACTVLHTVCWYPIVLLMYSARFWGANARTQYNNQPLSKERDYGPEGDN